MADDIPEASLYLPMSSVSTLCDFPFLVLISSNFEILLFISFPKSVEYHNDNFGMNTFSSPLSYLVEKLKRNNSEFCLSPLVIV